METIRDFLITLKSNLQKKLVYLKNYLQSHKAVTLFLAALLGFFLCSLSCIALLSNVSEPQKYRYIRNRLRPHLCTKPFLCLGRPQPLPELKS